MALTFFIRGTLVQPVPPPLTTPFGLYAMSSLWMPDLTVVSNRSHLSFIFPSAPYLDVVGPEQVLINLTTGGIIGSGRVPPVSVFYVMVVPTETASPFVLSDAAQGLAGLLGALAMLLPYPNPIIDSQLAVMAGTSYCFQGDVRDLSERGLRMVFIASTVADSVVFKLLSSLSAVGLVGGIHALVLVMSKVRSGSKPWGRMANILWFPSASYSVFLIALPGIFLAALRTFVNPSSTGGNPLISLGGALVAVFILLLVAATGRTGVVYAYVKATSRDNAFAVRDFPTILQAYMPARSWGPPKHVQSLQVPFYAHKEFLSHSLQCLLSMIYGMLGGTVLSFVCESTRSCAVQGFLLMMIASAHVVCIVLWLPYRSLLQSAAAAINTSALFVLLACNLSRCYFTSHGPMLTVSLAMLAVHMTSACRSLLNLVCGFLEFRVVIPRVWFGDGDLHRVTAAPWAAAFSADGPTSESGGASPPAVDMAKLLKERQPSPDELRDLRELEPPGVVKLTQTDDDRHMNILSQTLKSRAVLAEIPPMPKFVLPPLPGDAQSQRGHTANRLILRGPAMQHLICRDGPMPPALLAQCQREYELL